MLDIEYKGGNGVVISTKKTTLNVDPRLSVVGLKDVKTDNEIELATEARFVVGNPTARLVIESPGEYEVGDFTIHGVAATRHIDIPDAEKVSTMYGIECGEVKMAVLGNIAPTLNDEQLEALGVVDVLVLPVGGGGYTLDATSAVSMVRQIEPKVVIPVHYSDASLKYEVPQDVLDTFVKELGAPTETMSKYKIKSASSLPQSLTIVELSRS